MRKSNDYIRSDSATLNESAKMNLPVSGNVVGQKVISLPLNSSIGPAAASKKNLADTTLVKNLVSGPGEVKTNMSISENVKMKSKK